MINNCLLSPISRRSCLLLLLAVARVYIVGVLVGCCQRAVQKRLGIILIHALVIDDVRNLRNLLGVTKELSVLLDIAALQMWADIFLIDRLVL